MSGGSYNYLYSKDAEELFNAESNLEDMANRLAGLAYAEDAARETTELLLIIRLSRVRIEAIINRLSPIWRAIEYWDSCDSGESEVKKAMEKYRI